ncbi:MerR family transcriptional regulator [bacterium]|nr:MerR family transcriptional regulator [bacterium]
MLSESASQECATGVMKEEKKYLTIQDLASIVGVSTSALRAWERRYAIFSPERTQGGHRLYTQDDLKLFWFVTHLRGQGRDLKQIANLGREDLLKQANSFFELTSPDSKTPAEHLDTPEKKQLPATFHSILTALKADNTEAAIRALEQVYALSDNAVSFADHALDLMVEVGDHWHRGEISVAVEHALTARLKHMLLGLFYLNEPTSATQIEESPLAVCATLPNELHELGLLRVALYLKTWGYRVTYLGANTPIADLVDYCSRRQPALVIVSCASSLSVTSMLHSFQKLSLLVTPYAPVVVGGSGLNAINSAHPDIQNLLISRRMSDLELIAYEARKNLDKTVAERISKLRAQLVR